MQSLFRIFAATPLTLLTLLTLNAGMAQAQLLRDVIPSTEPNCALEAPPATSGLAGTPGGFVMVFPRNDALPSQYTGCKSMWIVNGDERRRMATLYFKSGDVAIVAAHNVRDPSGKLDAACSFPGGKSLLPDAGRKLPDSSCAGFTKEQFYQLHLPTWPMICLTDPKAAVCRDNPQ